MKNIINKIKKTFKKRLFKADMLLIISFFIIFVTTMALNIYIAFYLLAICLIAMSYILGKGGD